MFMLFSSSNQHILSSSGALVLFNAVQYNSPVTAVRTSRGEIG